MKVVLKTTVLDRIRDDIEKAERAGRLVDYVLVTPAEMADLQGEVGPRYVIENRFHGYLGVDTFDHSATFKTWDFSYQGTNPALYRSHIRVASSETIYGYPLLEVPAEYHPR